MTDYYVNPAAGGTNSGTQANPWTSIQTAFDTATAGDNVYCQGTQTISVRIDVDTNSGTDVAPIKIIGTNSSWVNDGTYFVIDVNNNNSNGIYCNARSNYWLENIEIKNVGGTGAAFYGQTNSDDWTLINVYVHDCAQHGFNRGQYMRFWTVFRLRVASCAGYGIGSPSSWRLSHAWIDSCDYGIYGDQTMQPHCVTISNCTTMGIYATNIVTARHITIDDCPTGISVAAATVPAYLEGCRITGATTGLAIATDCNVNLVGCYFGGNTADIALTGTGTYKILPINGAVTNVTLTGSDTGDGYVDAANNDYTLIASATGRSIPITVG